MTKEIRPISPDEIMSNLDKIIPSAIIQSVNELLKDGYRGGDVTIKQKDIVKMAVNLDNSLVGNIDKKKCLDFESIYEKAGWNVRYDKPGYNETYDAFFVFSPKKKIKKKQGQFFP
jgi:hypothetical protein